MGRKESNQTNKQKNCQYFLRNFLQAGREAIDMKHNKQDISFKAWVRAPGVDLGGGAEAKTELFQNMVMLHIKLKLTTLAAT